MGFVHEIVEGRGLAPRTVADRDDTDPVLFEGKNYDTITLLCSTIEDGDPKHVDYGVPKGVYADSGRATRRRA